MRSLKILIVEDMVDTAVSLQMLLEIDQHDCKIAYNSKQTLEILDTYTPDVILLDIGLPGKMDGYQLAKEIRLKLKHKLPMIVAITGHDTPTDIQLSNISGIHLHLTKPVDPEKLRGLFDKYQQVLK